MDPQVKELSVLLRHVPRIVVSHFLRNSEPLHEPTSTPFTAVVALFDISGFSSLGSKLSDDERDQIKAIQSSKLDKSDDDDGGTTTTSSTANGPRTSLPLGLGNNGPASISEDLATTSTTMPRSGSVRFNSRDLGNANAITKAGSNAASVDHSERSDSVPRDLMRQRRQSAQTSQVQGARNISFISRAKPAAPQGIAVETLTKTLNKTLEPVIDVILQHGGDIIKFAGDALIVIWETESSQGITTPEGLLVHSALRCALEALRVLHATSQRHGHTSILGMHVGIGVSRVTGNHVGGVLDRWEFYLSGDANRQMSSAEQDAGKGEVVLSKEAYRELMAVQSRVGAQIDVDETLRGNFLIHNVSRSAQYQPKPLKVPKGTLELVPFLRGYVPGTISAYLRKGLAINSCTRNITAVFIKLDGVVEIGNEPEQLKYIHKWLCLIQESAYKVQGTLRQFVIDDKGAVAIIAVGLPPFYHENNALRGVKLASFLLDKGLRGSIGVTTGNAFCGSVGSNARAEYAVVGDVINLAARLMSSATSGEILCDEVTRDESKDSMQYDDSHEITVKGKTAKVRVFRVQRQAQSNTKLDPTVLLDTVHGLPYGSEYLVELVPIFGSVAHRTDRRGAHKHRVLIITGESGTGKSMLLRHFLHHHARSFMGSDDPVDSALNFHAWGGIIKEMITRTVKTRRQQVSTHSGENGPTDLDLITSPDEYLDRFVTESVDSRVGSPDGSSTFQLKSHHRLRLMSMDDGDPRSVTPPSESLSNGRDSPSRTLSSFTNAYERVPVLEYLIRKQRISASMAPILNDLLPYDQLYEGTLDELEKGEERTKALESLIFNIVEAVSKQKPILLIFDNAQWMDGQSWSLLVKVLDELPNVSALIATRAMHRMKRQPMYDLVEQLPYVKKQEIRRFTYQVTSLFLCQHYHIAIMDTQLLDFVFARTDGNPAELIKLMEFMIHSQFVSIDRQSGSISILSDLDDLDMQVPQYTRAKVMACVDTLDGLAQVALKLISVHPEPVEERMLNGILTMFLSTSEHDDSETEGAGISSTKLKIPRSSSAMSILHQVRIGLAECEKEAIVTLDDQNKLMFFNSEEMRLVVYDTMLPSQREAIHLLYCQWFRDMTRPRRNSSIISVQPPSPKNGTTANPPTSGHRPNVGSIKRPSFAGGATTLLPVLDPNSSLKARLQQQFAMLGYHLSRSGNAKPSLNAYQKAAELALENRDLQFATDCMQSSFKILEDGPRVNKLNDLDYILVRSKIEFLRGAIAIEKSEWDMAIMHMSYIIRLCQRKGSVLRRYSSSVYRNESVLESTKTLAAKISSVRSASAAVPHQMDGGGSSVISSLKLNLGESMLSMEMQQRCLPRLFNFQRLIPSGYPASLSMFFMRRSINSGGSRRSSRGGSLLRMGSGSAINRVQPEETLLALNQVHFYRKKAEVLIKKINVSRRKQEEMSREIQKLTQKSLKKTQRR